MSSSLDSTESESSERSSAPPPNRSNTRPVRQTVNVILGGERIVSVSRQLVSDPEQLRFSDTDMPDYPTNVPAVDSDTDPDRTSDSDSPRPAIWAKLISLYFQNHHLDITKPVYTVGNEDCDLYVYNHLMPLCQLRKQGGPLLASLEILSDLCLVKVNGETKSKHTFVYLTPGDEVVFDYPSKEAYIFHPDPNHASVWNNVWIDYHEADPIQQDKRKELKRNLRERIVSPEDIEVSFENFPYFLSAITKDALIASPHVHMRYRREFPNLGLMSPRILLNGPLGTEIYQEMLGRALAKEFNAKMLIIESLVLPWDYFDSDSIAAERGEYIFQAGDRVTFCGVSSSSPIPTQNLRGPEIGFRGRVFLPFEGNGYSYIGVRFDQPIPDGHDLGDLCEKTHGFFCAASSLRLDDSFSTHANAIGINEIFEVAFSESKGGPFVLLLKNVKNCLGFSDVYERLKVKLKNLPKKFVVIASELGRPDDVDMSALFPNEVMILPPKDEASLLSWNEKLEDDMATFKARNISACLSSVLTKNGLVCPDLDLERIGVGNHLTLRGAEKVIGWAVSHHLRSCSKMDDKRIIPIESIEHGFRILDEFEDLQKDTDESG